MTKLKVFCVIVGVAQIVLGLLYLFAPSFFLNWQGLSPPAENIHYPLAMLAARFLVYGFGMFIIARNPAENKFWIDGMIAIQAIDLGAGAYYTAMNSVGIQVSGFPMFNAALIIAAFLWLRGYARQ